MYARTITTAVTDMIRIALSIVMTAKLSLSPWSLQTPAIKMFVTQALRQATWLPSGRHQKAASGLMPVAQARGVSGGNR